MALAPDWQIKVQLLQQKSAPYALLKSVPQRPGVLVDAYGLHTRHVISHTCQAGV